MPADVAPLQGVFKVGNLPGIQIVSDFKGKYVWGLGGGGGLHVKQTCLCNTAALRLSLNYGRNDLTRNLPVDHESLIWRAEGG